MQANNYSNAFFNFQKCKQAISGLPEMSIIKFVHLEKGQSTHMMWVSLRHMLSAKAKHIYTEVCAIYAPIYMNY